MSEKPYKNEKLYITQIGHRCIYIYIYVCVCVCVCVCLCVYVWGCLWGCESICNANVTLQIYSHKPT